MKKKVFEFKTRGVTPYVKRIKDYHSVDGIIYDSNGEVVAEQERTSRNLQIESEKMKGLAKEEDMVDVLKELQSLIYNYKLKFKVSPNFIEIGVDLFYMLDSSQYKSVYSTEINNFDSYILGTKASIEYFNKKSLRVGYLEGDNKLL